MKTCLSLAILCLVFCPLDVLGAEAPFFGEGPQSPGVPIAKSQAMAPQILEQAQSADAPPRTVAAAEPRSNIPMPDPDIPVQYSRPQALVALPAHVPPYLPNGAVNLDWVWTEDGGARDYWNYVLIPQQLRMGGLRWVDPALVPQLIQDKAAPAKRRYWRPRRKARPVARVKVPANAASTALNTPAIPLPVRPVEQARPASKPRKAVRPRASRPAPQVTRTEPEIFPTHPAPLTNPGEPPRLQ